MVKKGLRVLLCQLSTEVYLFFLKAPQLYPFMLFRSINDTAFKILAQLQVSVLMPVTASTFCGLLLGDVEHPEITLLGIFRKTIV